MTGVCKDPESIPNHHHPAETTANDELRGSTTAPYPERIMTG
jgi:hypothetical protein